MSTAAEADAMPSTLVRVDIGIPGGPAMAE